VKYLREGWLVIVLSLVFGAALAATYALLTPKIKENQKNETYDEIPNLVPGGVKDKTEEVQIDGVKAFKIFNAAGRHIGWVLPASGIGYADAIEALVGLDAGAKTITGVYVLDQKETPGLGSKITSPWNRQYVGKKTTPPLAVVRGRTPGASEIEAISGATVSSASLTEILNGAIENFRRALAAQKPEPAPAQTQPSTTTSVSAPKDS
jgi:electron transport complex protein RnfG